MRHSRHVNLSLMRLRYTGAQRYFAFLVIAICAMSAVAEQLSERPLPTRFEAKFSLVDHNGKHVTQEDYRGRWLLVFFGYTHCPDVCPTTMVDVSLVLRRLAGDARKVQALFITVDPERDRPEILKEYLAYFDARLLGLSASPEVTKRTAELFKARYERVPAADGDPRRYTMDHTASLYLLGRKGEYLTKFAHGLPAREVAARIRDYMSE